MAGLRGNRASIAFEKQVGRNDPVGGAALGAASDRVPFVGGNIEPVRSVAQLSETDSSRDQGTSYIERTGVEGSPEFYVRDSNIHHVLEAILGGAAAPSGVGPNYTHVLTPANALPYYTFYREIDGTLFEKFFDCQVSEGTISADTGSPLTASLSVVGRGSTRLTAAPAAQPAIASDAVYNMNEATVTLGGSVTSLVKSFELSINNNVSSQQTDDFVPYDVVPGLREVSLGFTLIFENLDLYNTWHYGSTTGTAQVGTLPTTSAVFSFSKGANNEVSFSLPSIAFEDFPVEPDAGGDPVEVDVRAIAQRGGSPVVTATVKNQEAT